MDTKWKGNHRYSLAAWGLLILFLTVAGLTGWDAAGHRAYLNKNYYFGSDPFYNQLTTQWGVMKYVLFENKNYPQLTLEQKLQAPRIIQLKESYERQKQDREQQIHGEFAAKRNQAQPLDNTSTGDTSVLLKEEQDRIAEARAQIDALLKKDTDRYIAYRDREYAEVKRSLDDRQSLFKYYIKNGVTDEVWANPASAAVPDAAKLSDSSLFSVALPQNRQLPGELQPINSYFQQNHLEGVFYIPANIGRFSQIHVDYEYYLAIRDRIIKEIALGSASLLLAAASFLAIRRFGWSLQGGLELLTARYRRVPADVRLVILGTVFLFALGFIHPEDLFRFPPEPGQLFQWAALYAVAFFAVTRLKEALFLYRHPEELKQQWDEAICSRLLRLVQSSAGNRSLYAKAALLFISTALLSVFCLLGAAGVSNGAGGLVLISAVYILLYLAIAMPYALKRIAAFNSILAGAEAISAGRFNQPIETAGSGNMYRLAHHLNNVNAGVRASVESRMKSERLKSELITNVSHDLKTPLTSIINYVDLLKNKDITAEQQTGYIEVLERKTQRLKALIDDLFEASKMASGAVELTLENVNVAALLNQALAEFSEQIGASDSPFKVSIPNHKVIARLDGKKIWRVFENLIGNALKYAMPHTRIHLILEETADKIVLTVKNVSAYPIDFDVSELLERFKRGDLSRHTEGSGLGLAIAKSIVDLHGGELLIEIDGDYFKVTVILDRKSEPEIEPPGN